MSSRLVPKQMMHLSETHPDVYRDFMAGHHVIRRSQRFWAGLSCDLTIEQTLMCSLKSSGGLTRGRGMGELQRLVWLLSMPSCAAVNQWMVSFTHGDSNTEHHKDLTEARQRKDDKDTSTIVTYVLQRNPFETEGHQLVCIATGLTSDTSANVDSAKVIGHRILQTMTGQAVSAVSFKKKEEAVTMSTKPTVKIGGERVSIDPQLLFQRLLHVAGGDLSKLQDIFQHELTALPSSLFDDSGFMRESSKHLLAKHLWDASEGCKQEMLRTKDVHYILDGGSLIHQLSWLRGTSYTHLAERYVEYVKNSYPHATVVFDGYFGGPSTKDMAHVQRRTLPGRDVQFTPDMLLSEKKEEFLSNTTNKQRFIHLVGNCFEENGIPVQHAQGDADCVIVQVALQSAVEYTTYVVGEDTDLLILLLFHVKSDMKDVFFSSSKASTTRLWDIRSTQSRLGPNVCKNILFAHAFSGCDTTSRPFSVGKCVPVKRLQKKNKLFENSAKVFLQTNSDHQMIAETGEKLLVDIYKGNDGDTLDKLRLVKYHEKVFTGSKQVQPKVLPPTSAAAKYHSYRVFYQVQEWACLGTSLELMPEEWGFQLQRGQLLPVHTDIPPAPEELMNIIRCGCTTDCSSQRCSCRKVGLSCTTACGQCRGISCLNSMLPMDEEEEETNI
ncbi:hypothetical protein V1264_013491 [Littorina saxatilis]|uniref:Tesmin/TSO1-like CXC domain-containing protein n=2 Tax=Littorina saxatilis TaxID=31220 RepID=A0AAN9BNA2_9CAEN